MEKAITKSLLAPRGLGKQEGLSQYVYLWATVTGQIIRKLCTHPFPYIGSVSVLGVVLCTQSKLQGLSTLPKTLSVTSVPHTHTQKGKVT